MAKSGASIIDLKPRLLEARADIQSYGPDDLEFTHAVLAQVGLPRRATEARTFVRRSGQTSIVLEAGQSPNSLGKWEPLPLPYGAHPRLILIHMASEAVRTRSRSIDVGQSIRSFFSRLDLSYNAVTLRNFKRQIRCLAAMHMTLAFPSENRVSTIRFDPISRFDGWLSLDPRQKSLWDDRIELTETFFDTLLSHAVPLDPRAINALQGSTLSLDVYTWLAHRLCRVKGSGTSLSWSNLKEQFGEEYRQLRDFKREFKRALAQAHTVYPDARLELIHGGIKLLPSPPPIPKNQVTVLPSKVSRKAPKKLEKETPEFPDSGSIHYGSWGAIARTEGGGWDIDMIASEFRSLMASKGVSLRSETIERAFRGFCRSYLQRRGPVR